MKKEIMTQALLKLAEVRGLLNELNMNMGLDEELTDMNGKSILADDAIEEMIMELSNGTSSGLQDRLREWLKDSKANK